MLFFAGHNDEPLLTCSNPSLLAAGIGSCTLQDKWGQKTNGWLGNSTQRCCTEQEVRERGDLCGCQSPESVDSFGPRHLFRGSDERSARL